jgi:hypothetical protein
LGGQRFLRANAEAGRKAVAEDKDLRRGGVGDGCRGSTEKGCDERGEQVLERRPEQAIRRRLIL